jgi:regulator of replication initiation timing
MQIPEKTKTRESGDTVEQKLMDCVRSLLESAGRLKSALVGRNVEAIWDALAEQEEQAGLLNEYTALWKEMSALVTPETALDLERRRLQLEIRRLQALQRANSMLAQSFLSAVRKAVNTVTDRASNGGGTYSNLGRRRAGGNSGLVKRYG